MKHTHYTLNAAGEPIPEPNLLVWAKWFGHSERKVAFDTIDDVQISTVFLGSDHNFGFGPPILWETMVFGGKLDQEQDRCSGSREQAEAMHDKMISRVLGSIIFNTPKDWMP